MPQRDVRNSTAGQSVLTIDTSSCWCCRAGKENTKLQRENCSGNVERRKHGDRKAQHGEISM